MKRSIAPSSEERGFIALISAVVMSAILMSLMYTVSASSFYARIDAESIESKRVSLGLAESCINVALLALAISSDPTNTSGHGYAPVHEVIVEMENAFIFVTGISDGSSLAVVAAADCDVGLVGYEMAMLVDKTGTSLTPELRAELQSALPR